MTHLANTTITILGTGPMGTAIGMTLLQKGAALTAWNRTAHKVEKLVKHGAKQAESFHAAIHDGNVIIISLANYEGAQEHFESFEASSLSGKIIINLSSGSPEDVKKMVKIVNKLGGTYLDGIILATPDIIGTEHAALFVSGDRQNFETYKNILEQLGKTTFLGEEISLAVIYNAAFLTFMYSSIHGYLHAAALANTVGVKPSVFAELGVDWFMPMIAELLKGASVGMDASEYSKEGASISSSIMGIDHITAASRMQGLSDTIPRQLHDFASLGMEQGYGEYGYEALYEVIRKKSLGNNKNTL